MLNPNLACILRYLCTLRRYWSFFVGTLDSCSTFLKHVTFSIETWYFDFAELHPLREKIGNAIDFILSCREMNRKRINDGFGTKIEIENIQLFWNNLLASLHFNIWEMPCRLDIPTFHCMPHLLVYSMDRLQTVQLCHSLSVWTYRLQELDLSK